MENTTDFDDATTSTFDSLFPYVESNSITINSSYPEIPEIIDPSYPLDLPSIESNSLSEGSSPFYTSWTESNGTHKLLDSYQSHTFNLESQQRILETNLVGLNQSVQYLQDE